MEMESMSNARYPCELRFFAMLFWHVKTLTATVVYRFISSGKNRQRIVFTCAPTFDFQLKVTIRAMMINHFVYKVKLPCSQPKIGAVKTVRGERERETESVYKSICTNGWMSIVRHMQAIVGIRNDQMTMARNSIVVVVTIECHSASDRISFSLSNHVEKVKWQRILCLRSDVCVWSNKYCGPYGLSVCAPSACALY